MHSYRTKGARDAVTTSFTSTRPSERKFLEPPSRMVEDEIYRSSSQYRLWSYTKESLAQIRRETNQLASERVKAAFRRVHASNRAARHGQRNDGDAANGSAAADGDDVEIETLTDDEELKIVEWGCSKIVDMGEAMNPRIPSHVVVSLDLRIYLWLCHCASQTRITLTTDDTSFPTMSRNHLSFTRPYV